MQTSFLLTRSKNWVTESARLEFCCMRHAFGTTACHRPRTLARFNYSIAVNFLNKEATTRVDHTQTSHDNGRMIMKSRMLGGFYLCSFNNSTCDYRDKAHLAFSSPKMNWIVNLPLRKVSNHNLTKAMDGTTLPAPKHWLIIFSELRLGRVLELMEATNSWQPILLVMV